MSSSPVTSVDLHSVGKEKTSLWGYLYPRLLRTVSPPKAVDNTKCSFSFTFTDIVQNSSHPRGTNNQLKIHSSQVWIVLVIHCLLSRELNTSMQQLAQHMVLQII